MVRHRGIVFHRRSPLALVCLVSAAVVASLIAVVAFVPAAGRSRPSPRLQSSLVVSAAAEEKKDYGQYDWQKVAESSDKAGAAADLNPDAFPDIAEFADAPPAPATPSSGARSLGATTKERRIDLPDLPGFEDDEDLLPPAPNPIVDGGLGLWEWTGIWIVGSLGIVAIGGALSWGLARAQIDPDFADKSLIYVKYFLGFFQILFLGRVLLTQFPNIKTEEMPWAPLHYTTEWALAPTRSVFKPEAGVDVAPILWLITTLLASELLTGPSGILIMAKSAQDGSKSMSIR